MPTNNKNINNLEKLNQYALDLAYPILKNISLYIIRQVRNPKKTYKITNFQNSEPFKLLVQKMITTGSVYGAYVHKEQIRSQIEDKLINFAVEDDFTMKTGFQGAKEFFIDKKVIDIDKYNSLSNTAKETAFSVAKLTDLTVTEHLRDLITTAIDEGMDLAEYQAQVAEMVAKVGITPLNPYYIENVFRTNLLSTYNIGHRRAGLDDLNTVAFRFLAVGDSRTRDTHLDLSGTTAPKNDPIWDQITPPLDYQCRCTIISLSQYYLDNKKGFEYKTISSKKALASVGDNFKISPDSLANYNKVLTKQIRIKSAA